MWDLPGPGLEPVSPALACDGGGGRKGVWRQLWWDEPWDYAQLSCSSPSKASSFMLLPEREGL